MPDTQPKGYLAIPADGKGSAVLVLHAWWGLNAALKAFCDRLAAAGFIAFAPDLYRGRLADTIPVAKALSNALDEDQAMADVRAAAAYLADRSGQTGEGITVIGFSLGAYLALQFSVTDPDAVRGVVVFYGTRPGDYSASKAAYQGHFAEDDEFEPRDQVDQMEADLRLAARPARFYYYPGTGHWFFEPDRVDAFNQAAADMAWKRTLEFLKKPPAG